MEIIDITRKISGTMPLWPGDTPFSIKRQTTIKDQGCNTSNINMGLHTGTHIDAPRHFINDGKKIQDVKLNKFCGYCKVFEVIKKGNLNESDMRNLNIEKDDIILFKTANSKIRKREFTRKFCSLSYTAAKYLVDKNIKCVGIDYLSVESYNGNGGVHKLLLQNEIGIIEGLDLNEVKQGQYFLSALPLKIDNAEASPVRAVLISF